MSEQEEKIVTAMEQYGGSFVKALFVCFRRADHKNFFILQMSFIGYWKQYAEMAGIKEALEIEAEIPF